MLWNGYLKVSEMASSGDILAFHRPVREFAGLSLSEYGQFPHWNPYYYGGTPHWANAQNTFFSFSVLIPLLVGSMTFGNEFDNPLQPSL